MIDIVDVESFSWDIFIKHYWKKKPLVITNGNRLFQSAPINDLSIREYYSRCKFGISRVNLIENDDVLFYQSLPYEIISELKIPKINDIFDGHHVWIDSVITTSSRAGIGCHFDHSDNFVLQQYGSKTWRLGSPNDLSFDDQFNRLYGKHGVGSLPSSFSFSECTLEEGSTLYIPFMCPHEGSSCGVSVSISIVVNPIMETLQVEQVFLRTLKSYCEDKNILMPNKRQMLNVFSSVELNYIADDIYSQEVVRFPSKNFCTFVNQAIAHDIDSFSEGVTRLFFSLVRILLAKNYSIQFKEAVYSLVTFFDSSLSIEDTTAKLNNIRQEVLGLKTALFSDNENEIINAINIILRGLKVEEKY